MKVVCKTTTVGNDKSLHLTVGKTYDVLDYIGGIVFKIRNDVGVNQNYTRDKFETLESFRQQKLNELGL